MEVCTGRYLDQCVFNRIDFAEKMRTGVSFEEYMEAERNAGFRIAFGPGSSGKNRYVIYSYEVDGRTYYGANHVAYSADIRKRMAGRDCIVEYDPANPWNAHVSKSDEMRGGSALAITCLVTGILSGCFSFTGIVGIISGIVSIVLFALYMKKQSDGPFKIMAIVGVILGVLGVILSLILGLMYLIMFLLMLGGMMVF